MTLISSSHFIDWQLVHYSPLNQTHKTIELCLCSQWVWVVLHCNTSQNRIQLTGRLQTDIFISILATKLKSGQIFKIKCPTEFRSMIFSFQSIIPSLVRLIKVNEALPSFFNLTKREKSNLFFTGPYNTISLLSEVRGFYLPSSNDQILHDHFFQLLCFLLCFLLLSWLEMIPMKESVTLVSSDPWSLWIHNESLPVESTMRLNNDCCIVLLPSTSSDLGGTPLANPSSCKGQYFGQHSPGTTRNTQVKSTERADANVTIWKWDKLR